MDVSEIKEKKRSPKETIIYNAIIIVCVVLVVVLMAVLKVGAWVPFVALCLWAMKITLDPKVILKNYIGAAVGLGMGYILRHAGELGTWALVVFIVCVLCLFITMVNQIPVLNIFFNDWTAVYTSIGTAMPYTLTIYFDWLFAFIIFGVTVIIAGLIMNRKGSKKDEQTSA